MAKLNEKLLSSSKKLSNVRSRIRSTEGLAVGDSVSKTGAAKGGFGGGDGLKKMSKPEEKKLEGKDINSEVIKPKNMDKGTVKEMNKTLGDGNEKNKLDSLVKESKNNINNDLGQKTEVNSNIEKVVNEKPKIEQNENIVNDKGFKDPNKLVDSVLKSVGDIFNADNNSNVGKIEEIGNELVKKVVQGAFGGGSDGDGGNDKEKGDVLNVGENVEKEKEISDVGNNESNDKVEDIDDIYSMLDNVCNEKSKGNPEEKADDLEKEMNDTEKGTKMTHQPSYNFEEKNGRNQENQKIVGEHSEKFLKGRNSNGIGGPNFLN